MSKYGDISTVELLENMDREQEVFIPKWQYGLALASWAVSVIAPVIACLLPKTQIPIAIGVFVLTIAVASFTGIFTGRFPFKVGKPHYPLDWVNAAIYWLCIPVFAVAFFITVTSGGLPRVTETGYALMNGSKLIRELDETAYRFYSAARGAMLTILTFFNCIQLAYVRKQRENQVD